MKKKKLSTLILAISLALSLVFLTACSGSKSIQGTWKAQDIAGTNYTIEFTDEEVIVDGESFDYTQNAIGTKNGISYHGIKQDGEDYSIVFPDKDKDIAIMIQPDSTDDYFKGVMLYAMNKTTEPDYMEYAKKYLK